MQEAVASGTLSFKEMLKNLSDMPRVKEFETLQRLLPEALAVYSVLLTEGTTAGNTEKLDLIFAFQCLNADYFSPECSQLTKAGRPCRNSAMQLTSDTTFKDIKYLRTCSEHKEDGCCLGTASDAVRAAGGSRRSKLCGTCAKGGGDSPICCRLCPAWSHRSCVLDLIDQQNLAFDDEQASTYAICQLCFLGRFVEFLVVEPLFRLGKSQLVVVPPVHGAGNSRTTDALPLLQAAVEHGVKRVVWLGFDEEEEMVLAGVDTVLSPPLTGEKARTRAGTAKKKKKKERSPSPPSSPPGAKDSRDPAEKRKEAKRVYKAAVEHDSGSSAEDESESERSSSAASSRRAKPRKARAKGKKSKSTRRRPSPPTSSSSSSSSSDGSRRKSNKRDSSPSSSSSSSSSDSSDSDDSGDHGGHRRGGRSGDKHVRDVVRRELRNLPGKIPKGPSSHGADPTGRADGWGKRDRGGPQTKEAIVVENYTGMGTLKQQESCVLRIMGVKRLDKVSKDLYLPENTCRTDTMIVGGQTFNVEKTGVAIPLRDTFDLWTRRRLMEWRGIVGSRKGVYKRSHKHFEYFKLMGLLIVARYQYLQGVVIHLTSRMGHPWEVAWRYVCATAEDHYRAYGLDDNARLDRDMLELASNARGETLLGNEALMSMVQDTIHVYRLDRAITMSAPRAAAPRVTPAAGRTPTAPTPAAPGAAPAAPGAPPQPPPRPPPTPPPSRPCPLCNSTSHNYRAGDYGHTQDMPITVACNARRGEETCGLFHARGGILKTPCRWG